MQHIKNLFILLQIMYFFRKFFFRKITLSAEKLNVFFPTGH